MSITRINELYPEFWQVWHRSSACICNVCVSGTREIAEQAEQIIYRHLQTMREELDQLQRRHLQCNARAVDTTEAELSQVEMIERRGSDVANV